MTASSQSTADAAPEAPPDAAWVLIDTSWRVDELRTFIEDVPRLLRINPMLTITRLEPAGDERLHLVAHNASNDRAVDVTITIDRRADGIALAYDHGLKASTRLAVEAGAGGAQLRITDDYSRLDPQDRADRVGEVDLSLTAWGHELHDYFRSWSRLAWLAPWRWYTTRVWLAMSPAARRITRLICVISALELVAFLVVVLIWTAA